LKKKPVWLGIVLIVIGAAMLLDHFRVLTMSWWLIFWASVAVGSLVMLIRNGRKKEGGIFWLTILFFFAVYKTIWHIGAWELDPAIGFPLVLVVAGIGLTVLVGFSPKRWHLLVPGFLLIAVGAAMILSEYDVIQEWQVRSAIQTYWPVALVIFGAALLLNSGWGRKEEGGK
jgi:hypothetical protein